MNRYVEALEAEVMNRARIYYLIFKELSREVGQDRAVGILKRALYERGREKGRELARKIGEPDLERLAAAFVEGKEGMDVFGHEIVEVKGDHALLRLNRCPLVEEWEALGLSSEEKRTLCDFAYQVDFGKFETAGYRLRFNCRIAEGGSSCDLHLTK